MERYSRFALVVLALVLVLMLTACNQLVQPTNADIARANCLLLEEPCAVHISLDIIKAPIIAYYESDVLCHADRAYWDGIMKVLYSNTYFQQACVSQKDAERSAKEWRGCWAAADTDTPLTAMQRWLSKVEAGACLYDQVPKTVTINGCEEEVYTLMLQETGLDMNWLCDADMDSLFGGDAVFADVKEFTVELLVGTKDLLIRQVNIAATGENWCEATLTFQPADAFPQLRWESELVTEAYLNEEWFIIGSLEEESNTQTE